MSSNRYLGDQNVDSDEEEYDIIMKRRNRPTPDAFRGGRVGGDGFVMPEPGDVSQPPPTPGSGSEFRSMTMAMSMPEPSIGFHLNPNLDGHAETRFMTNEWPKTIDMPDPPILPQLTPERKWNEQEAQLSALPIYFPRDLIKLELPMQELHGALECIPKCIRYWSIQAEYQNTPTLSAKLLTKERVGLTLNFWKSKNEGFFYIDIQRNRGDHMDANRYVQKLLDAARGEWEEPEEKFQGSADPDAQQHEDLESLINQVMSSTSTASPVSDNDWMFRQSPEQVSKAAMETVYKSLTSQRLDLRSMGLKCLMTYTDLNRTLSSTAIPCALAVLQAQAPNTEYAIQCQEIQKIFLLILQKREFEQDLFPKDMVVDSDWESFMPSAAEETTRGGPPPPYVEYMGELFQLALAVLVNALEVVSCFQDQLYDKTSRIRLEQLTTDLFRTAQSVSGVDLYATLMDCVRRADRQLANGYLACKALRLLGKANPKVQYRLKHDHKAAHCIGVAVQLGRARHALLQTESEKLWQVHYAGAS